MAYSSDHLAVVWMQGYTISSTKLLKCILHNEGFYYSYALIPVNIMLWFGDGVLSSEEHDVPTDQIVYDIDWGDSS